MVAVRQKAQNGRENEGIVRQVRLTEHRKRPPPLLPATLSGVSPVVTGEHKAPQEV